MSKRIPKLLPSQMEFNYSTPDLKSLQGEVKPYAYQGKDYPLHNLSHRDFEFLIYSIYKQEIGNKKLLYDDIALMSGVRDKAQDCIFYIDKIKCGLIQCKHSKNDTPLATRGCVEEIIKFCLYYIQDNSLIPDIKQFTYFFASSSGFDTKADHYLRSFTLNIKKERKIELWTKSIIKKYTLINLSYEEIKDKLAQLLSSLEVKLIIPNDIQDLLTRYQSTTSNRFFTLRLVVDNSSVQELKGDIELIKLNTKPKNISSERIIKEFDEASLFLFNYKSTFSVSDQIRIKRKATESIVQWLLNNLKDKEENILIIKGSAGSGKSVILNNIYGELKELGIPTIALKADEINATDIMALDKKLGLTISLQDSVESIAREYPKIVILIDQLDALSQSLSADRDNLATYILLIEKLKKIDNVRIVISVREYDLAYDPSLIPFKKNTSFSVGTLTPEEVKVVLANLKVTGYSEKLMILLSTPLHLELFCQVYKKRSEHLKLKSLYDLYNELWKQKIEKRGKKLVRESLKSTLYSIAKKIYERLGSLSVNGANFDIDDIEYLKTEGLLLENNRNEVMFFHQTFYDYVFARSFVESQDDVLVYINDNNQGLFIRSCLKIILAHIREQNPSQYQQLIKDLLQKPKIRFHIKQLVLDYLGFIENLILVEEEITEEVIINSNYETVFIEAINTNKWIELFIKKRWINKHFENSNSEKLNVVFQMLIRNLKTSREVILNFLLDLPSNETNNDIIARLLYFLEDWNDEAIILYNRARLSVLKSPFQFCTCIEKSTTFNKDWAIKEFLTFLLSKVQLLNKQQHEFQIDHTETELIKKLFLVAPIETFHLCKQIIEKIIIQTRWEHKNGGLNEDGAFYFFTHSKENYHGDDEFFQIFINKIEEFAITKSPYFDEFILEFGKSNYVGLLRLVIYGLLANPKEYYNEALEIIKYINIRNGFVDNEKLEYFVRQLINVIYPLVSYNERKEINQMIENIKAPYENETFIHPITKKKERRSFTGHTQYKFLSAIPIENLIAFTELHKRFLELKRKFGDINDKEPNIITISGSHPPYSKTNYEKMSNDDWISTFHKYNENFEPDFFSHKGGITEHGRAFEEQVTLRSDAFYPLVQKIVSDNGISDDYKVFGINGLIKGNFPPDLISELIEKLIETPLNGHNTLYIIWSIDYLIKHKMIGEKIFNFLCNEALNNSDPEKDDLNDPIQRSINTIRGAAIDRLMKLDNKDFELKLFLTINKAIKKEKILAVKFSIAHNSAYLLKIDQLKAFRIFCKVTKSDKRLLKHSMWSAEYFSYRYFSQMKFFFEAALKNSKVYKELSNMLSKLYLRNMPKAEKFLFPLLKKNTEAKAEAISVACHPKNIINLSKSLNGKCVELFKMGLNSANDKIVHQYSVSFLHFKPEMFSSLFPVLVLYSKSKVFKSSPANFCKYITQCCNKATVIQCMELISLLGELPKTDITKGNYYDSEPLNLILAIYNTLGNSHIDKLHKDKCMDVFDKMLQQPQHRIAASQAIQFADL